MLLKEQEDSSEACKRREVRKMGNVYDWMEDEIGNFARDAGIEFDEVVFPWRGNPEWDPATFARKDLVAVLKDEDSRTVGEVCFRIIVNPDYGKTYEYLWKIDEKSVRVTRRRDERKV